MVDERRFRLRRVVEVGPVAGTEGEERERVGVLVEDAVGGLGLLDLDRHLAVIARVAVAVLRQHGIPGPREQPQVFDAGAGRSVREGCEEAGVAELAEVHLVEAGLGDRDLDPVATHEQTGVGHGRGCRGPARAGREALRRARAQERSCALRPPPRLAGFVVDERFAVDGFERIAESGRRAGCGSALAHDLDLDLAVQRDAARGRLVVGGEDRDRGHTLVTHPRHADQPRALGRLAGRGGVGRLRALVVRRLVLVAAREQTQRRQQHAFARFPGSGPRAQPHISRRWHGDLQDAHRKRGMPWGRLVAVALDPDLARIARERHGLDPRIWDLDREARGALARCQQAQIVRGGRRGWGQADDQERHPCQGGRRARPAPRARRQMEGLQNFWASSTSITGMSSTIRYRKRQRSQVRVCAASL